MAESEIKPASNRTLRGRKPGRIPQWVEDQLRFAAEVSSLFLLLGFILSAAVNGLVFTAWGLSFAQLATPTDVLMSGLQLAAIIVLPTAVAGLAATGGMYVGDRVAAMAPIRWGLPSKHSKGTMLAIFTGATALGYIALVVSPRKPSSLIVGDSAGEALQTATANMASAFGTAVIALALLLAWTVSGGWDRRVKSAFTIVFVTIVGGLLMVFSGSALIATRIEHGYQPQVVLIDDPAREICDGTEARVLWIGSDSLIVRCGLDDPGFPVIVIRNSDEVRLEVLPNAEFRCDRNPFAFPRTCRVAISDY